MLMMKNLDLILLATGSEVETSIKLAEDIEKGGIGVRVVSMPSMELFLKQKSKYEDELVVAKEEKREKQETVILI